MAKDKSIYTCTECGGTSARWMGKCPSCEAWNSLIEGAAEGAGLGHLFLRHLQRTRLLLHVVDFAPFDENVDTVAQAKAIVNELKKYDPALHKKPRWLVLNKLDMVDSDERAALVKDFVKRLKYKGPVFEISALTREGCEPLIKEIYKHIKAVQLAEQPHVEIDPRFTPNEADTGNLSE